MPRALIAVVLVATAAILTLAGLSLGAEGEAFAWVAALFGLAVIWAVTRPWHPVVPPLYRHSLHAAFTDWAEAVDRWQQRADRKGDYEAQRATDDLVLRLEALRPPRGQAADHAALHARAAEYAAALRAWHRAPTDRHAQDRLQAAHDALG